MLKPKKGYENTVIEYRVGQATMKIRVEDITKEHIEKAKHYVDLSYFVEEVKSEYDPKKHDAENIIQEYMNQPTEQILDLQTPKKKRTRRKK
jgi:hypothetical protein